MRKKGKTEESAPEVLKLTRRMTTLFRDRLEEQLRPLGITAAQLQLLAALAKRTYLPFLPGNTADDTCSAGGGRGPRMDTALAPSGERADVARHPDTTRNAFVSAWKDAGPSPAKQNAPHSYSRRGGSA